MSGWFSDVEVDDIPDDPNELPNNTYMFKVTSAVIAKTKANPNKPEKAIKTGITWKYQIIEGAWSTFFPLSDWVQCPDENTKPEEVTRMLSNIKMRLLAFGFSVDEIKDFGPEMITETVGRNFYGTTYLRKDKETQRTNININKFKPIDDDDVDLMGNDEEPAY